jgi:hypothetical protein
MLCVIVVTKINKHEFLTYYTKRHYVSVKWLSRLHMTSDFNGRRTLTDFYNRKDKKNSFLIF